MNDIEKFIKSLSIHTGIPYVYDKNNVESTKCRIVEIGWYSSLYWVFIHENIFTDFNMPFKKCFVEPYKYHGIMVHKVMILCKELEPYIPDDMFGNWFKWFVEILKESVELSKIPHISSKDKKLKFEEYQYEKLLDYVNPYDEVIEPQLYFLVKTAIENNHIPKIEIVYYDFVKSIKKWINCRKRNSKSGKLWLALFEECVIQDVGNHLKTSHYLSLCNNRSKGKSKYTRLAYQTKYIKKYK